MPGVFRADPSPFGRAFPRASVIVTLFSAARTSAVSARPCKGPSRVRPGGSFPHRDRHRMCPIPYAR
ncbi:hypothetical protein GCM10010250_51150 [Streptomyces althioticus]|nr:hypothetical protein GCM10010250_51150 [Streptomyces althioticus]